MTEKEKAQSGQLYDASNDATLIAERDRCKEMCYQYNQLPPSHKHERHTLLRNLLGRIGREFLIEQPFYCDYGYNIEIGENFYMNVNCVILDCARVTFGDNVLIGPNCGFYTAGHPLDINRRNQGLEYASSIRIGNNVWIGAGVSILPGVTIGDGAVIGAGSVVNKDVPPNTLVVGNPIRIIRSLN